MQYRQLGRSELRVSEIALGSWLTYGAGVRRDEALACVQRALELGVTLFDTANVYAGGAAEELLGEALRDRDRSSYLLATKLFFSMTRQDRGLSAAQVRKQLDGSLARLRTDYVDLYQCHRYDRDTPLEETMQALTEAVHAGKVRSIGFSEWSPDQIRASFAIPGVERFVSSQPQYSMVWRKPEAEVFGVCRELGIGQIVFSPLAQGVLTGKYQPGQRPPRGTRGASRRLRRNMGDHRSERVLEAVQRLHPIAEEQGLSMSNLALAWVLRRPEVSAAIVGASRLEQLDDNLRASGVELDSDVLARIDAALADVPGAP